MITTHGIPVNRQAGGKGLRSRAAKRRKHSTTGRRWGRKKRRAWDQDPTP